MVSQLTILKCFLGNNRMSNLFAEPKRRRKVEDSDDDDDEFYDRTAEADEKRRRKAANEETVAKTYDELVSIS